MAHHLKLVGTGNTTPPEPPQGSRPPNIALTGDLKIEVTESTVIIFISPLTKNRRIGIQTIAEIRKSLIEQRVAHDTYEGNHPDNAYEKVVDAILLHVKRQ